MSAQKKAIACSERSLRQTHTFADGNFTNAFKVALRAGTAHCGPSSCFQDAAAAASIADIHARRSISNKLNSQSADEATVRGEVSEVCFQPTLLKNSKNRVSTISAKSTPLRVFCEDCRERSQRDATWPEAVLLPNP